MKFDPFEVSVAHIAYSLLGGFVVIFGMFSLWLKARLYISEAVWATLFGIIVGPYCAGIFDPRSWAGSTDEQGIEVTNTVTLEVMRVVLAIGVFAIGVELPKAYLWRHVRSVLLILFPVMAWGWIVCAGLIYGLVPGLDFLSSLIIAACLTPTDPILASAVVGGKWADKHVPAHLRHLLAAESAVNDGLAFPFLYLGMYLFLETNARTAVGEWIYWTILYEVTLGCVMGTVLGVGFRHLMQFCERKDLIDRTSYLAQYVSLALLAIGVTTLLGTDDLLCAFFAGTGFGWNGFFQKQTEDSMFSNAMDLLFNVAAFIYIGAWLPFSSYADTRLTLSVWRLVVLGILVILVRRIPICLAIYTWIPDIKTFREALFTGHFGPMGVGAIFISTLAATQLPSKGALGTPPYTQEQLLSGSIQPIVSFIVLCSVLSHGLSVPAFSLSKRVHSLSMTAHTRSWSRQASRETGHREPEWATQARRVHRPEDVVINRDVDLEKGALGLGLGVRMEGLGEGEEEVGAMDRENERPKGPEGVHREGGTEEVGVERDTAGGGLDMRGEGEGGGSPCSGAPASGSAAGSGSGALEDQRPAVSTWKQGNYMVLERDPGHGADVEVEVVRRSIVPAIEGRQTFTARTLEEARALGREYVVKLEQKARQIRAELLREGKITLRQSTTKARWGEQTIRRLSGLEVGSVDSVGEGGEVGEVGEVGSLLRTGPGGGAGAGAGVKPEAVAGPSGTIHELGHGLPVTGDGKYTEDSEDPPEEQEDDAWRDEGDPEVSPDLPAGEPLDDICLTEAALAHPLPARRQLQFREPASNDHRPPAHEPEPTSPDTPVRESHYPHHHSRFIRNAKRAIVHAAHAPGKRREARRTLLAGRKNKSASPPAPAGEPISSSTAQAHQRSGHVHHHQHHPPRPILTSATSTSDFPDSSTPNTNTTVSLPGTSVPYRLRSPSPTRGSRGSSPARSVRWSDSVNRSVNGNGNGNANGVDVLSPQPQPVSAPAFTTGFNSGTKMDAEGPGSSSPSPGENANTASTISTSTAPPSGARVRFDTSQAVTR
ncbi:hypothetical protein DACRYDRAFT_70529 [Dacryopinax primogenitus]|uniref:Cation/H+ exchanger transmembrane domain-containing protein n=1 Tax=Dacryopinax primogenitus (strain DJM 731) TaxID=1858805 RepID=M5FSA5_DACPD|nr:uncharacterized protein DACRYDRAFT_70529 [Dacryopinax primogenitus]EJT98683.1 hypothetical protein DACRYDRAFT_70529 [Dacryopinax primogenitus]